MKSPFYFAHNFVGQEFKKDLAEQLSLRVPQAAAVRCWLGCRDLKALWGVYPIWLTHLAGSRCRSSAETQLGCQSECLYMVFFFSVTISNCLFGTWLDHRRELAELVGYIDIGICIRKSHSASLPLLY